MLIWAGEDIFLGLFFKNSFYSLFIVRFICKRSHPMDPRQKNTGQGLLEYALIIALVALIVIVILTLIGPAVGDVFSNLIPNI
jgi:pilus assembly protein Flp/PilA